MSTIESTITNNNNRLGVALRKHCVFQVMFEIITQANVDPDQRYNGQAFVPSARKRTCFVVGTGDSGKTLADAGYSNSVGSANVQDDYNLTNALKGGALSVDNKCAILGLEFFIGNHPRMLAKPSTLDSSTAVAAVDFGGGVVANEYADITERLAISALRGATVSLLPQDSAAGCLVPLGRIDTMGAANAGFGSSGLVDSIGGSMRCASKLVLGRDTIIVDPNKNNLSDLHPNQIQIQFEDRVTSVQPASGTTGPAAANITSLAAGSVLVIDCCLAIDYAEVVLAAMLDQQGRTMMKDGQPIMGIRGASARDNEIITFYRGKVG